MKTGQKRIRPGAILVGLLLAGAIFGLLTHMSMGTDWRTASRESAGIAPLAADHAEAVVQVYAARAFAWRGAFAVHSWIAVKERNADSYRVMQVVGWRVMRGAPAVSVAEDLPDRHWFGSEPELLLDLRGETAEGVIPYIEEAVARYPWPDEYTLWPGPNSNTFTAWVAREVPALGLDLPSTAVGKDWLGPMTLVGPAPSNTGWQASVYGLVGVLAGLREGVEVNLAGLVFGIDPLGLAIKLPFVGRLGMERSPTRVE